mgnify:CR=1 FL=1
MLLEKEKKKEKSRKAVIGFLAVVKYINNKRAAE